MPRLKTTKPPVQRDRMRHMFETRSHSWAEVGLARQLSRAAVKRARIETLLLVPITIGVVLVYTHRKELFGPDLALPVRVATVVAMLILGWWLARAAGRALGPMLFRRMDPATAGTVGFLIRLATIVVTAIVAAQIAGLSTRSLTVGGAFTAVILGLAAQQTLGNLFAGLVLLSARPFRVGERVRLQGGGIAGQLEGVVSQLGLLYTVFADGEDEIMVPNNVVLNVAVLPLREPDAVDMRARLRPGVTPMDIQALLEREIDVPLLDRPEITLEELDGDEVVVRIQATPVASNDGPRLASEILGAVARETRGGDRDPTPAGPRGGEGSAGNGPEDEPRERDGGTDEPRERDGGTRPTDEPRDWRATTLADRPRDDRDDDRDAPVRGGDASTQPARGRSGD
jgi:small conductance mechanosensitive channel